MKWSFKMVELIHITSVKIAFDILSSKRYKSMNNYGSYDGGMNFLGVLGEYKNTQPKARGVKLHFVWEGVVSEPVKYTDYGCDKANVLYDFNGSGEHFKNNDPRYFLPYDSSGLKVTKLEIDDDESLLQGWCAYKGGIAQYLYSKKLLHSVLLKYAKKHVSKVDNMILSKELDISICREKTATD